MTPKRASEHSRVPPAAMHGIAAVWHHRSHLVLNATDEPEK